MRLFLTILLSISLISAFSQRNPNSDKAKKSFKEQTIFGLQVSPIIPSNFIQKNDYTYQSDTANYSITYQPSVSYGIEIRHYFTYRFALNTGIIYTKRLIKTDFETHYPTGSDGTDTTFSRELSFIAFEIPIKASGYVRLSKEIYMSIAGGINLNFYPSDIRVDNVYMQRAEHMNLNALQFFQLGFSVSLGWEFRTKENGIFYLGASYQTRLEDMAYILFFEEETIHSANYYQGTKGNYLSIDLKYFLPINETKKR